MTEGFAMLFGWLGWFALLGALSWAVMRRTTKRAPTGFNEMSERPGGRAAKDRSPAS